MAFPIYITDALGRAVTLINDWIPVKSPFTYTDPYTDPKAPDGTGTGDGKQLLNDQAAPTQGDPEPTNWFSVVNPDGRLSRWWSIKMWMPAIAGDAAGVVSLHCWDPYCGSWFETATWTVQDAVTATAGNIILMDAVPGTTRCVFETTGLADGDSMYIMMRGAD